MRRAETAKRKDLARTLTPLSMALSSGVGRHGSSAKWASEVRIGYNGFARIMRVTSLTVSTYRTKRKVCRRWWRPSVFLVAESAKFHLGWIGPTTATASQKREIATCAPRIQWVRDLCEVP